MKKLNILGISGSASSNSSNLSILKFIKEIGKDDFNLSIIDDLTKLPHFKAELTSENTPQSIIEFRNQIVKSDAIIISTPEYVFSIPSGLKNAIEWCVSETILTDKVTGLITASSHGQKGHEELILIMKTLQAKFTSETTLLIQGAKGKISEMGDFNDKNTQTLITEFLESFVELSKETMRINNTEE